MMCTKNSVLSAICISTCLASASLADVEYSYDDGNSNITLGPPRSFEQFGNIDMLWGNYYFTEQDTEFVTSLSFELGRLSAGKQISLWVFDDLDNDADPTNASVVFSTTLTAPHTGSEFNVIDIASTAVSGGFFVAVGHLAELTYDDDNNPSYPSPARFDPDGRADRSWFFYDDDIPEDNLADSGFVQRMDGPFVPIQGAFAVRATTVPVPGTLLVSTALLIGVSRRRRSTHS